MSTDLKESGFLRLPVQPDDGFPHQFQLAFGGKVYRFTLTVSYMTLEPFRIWVAGNASSAETLVRRSLTFPLGTGRPRVQLPLPLEGEPERMLYTLPQEELYLVMKLERDDLPEDRRVLGITRPVLDVPIRVAELVFLFKKIHIARGNLLGPGSYGSEIVAGVTAYAD